VDVTNWKLDPVIAADAFVSPQVASAKRIEFARKEALPAGAAPMSGTLKPQKKPKQSQ
jgi:hypothetical protein